MPRASRLPRRTQSQLTTSAQSASSSPVVTGGAYCDGVLGFYRATVYQSVDYADPACLNDSIVAAPPYGPPQNVTQELKLTHSLPSTLQPFVTGIPAPSNPEFIAIGVIGGVEPWRISGDEFFYFEFGMLRGLTTYPDNGRAFPANQGSYGVHSRGMADAFGSARAADPLWTDVLGPFTQDTASVVNPGDNIGAQVSYVDGSEFGEHHDYFQSDVIVCYGYQNVIIQCAEHGRLVSYTGPMPAAIDHYEALVYYNTPIPIRLLKENLGTITDNPYRFPEQPAYDPVDVGHSSTGSYEFVIRAVYHDGSWREGQGSCLFTPPAAGKPIFRHRHKAHS